MNHFKDRTLPNYTRGEEICNSVTHIVGAGLAVLALLLCVLTAVFKGNVWGIVSGAVYGVTQILLYTMSGIYHGLVAEKPKRVFRVIDHCTIYLLIAGTYTPITLVALRPVYPSLAWMMFALVWGVALFAITLTAIDLARFRVFSMICYLAMGWCVIFNIGKTAQVLGTNGMAYLVSGGILYTVGAVLYIIGKQKSIRYIHSVFHLFVLGGSALHFLMILLFILPIR